MKANEHQVAGGHYRTKYQHWDFVHDVGLDYFRGQVTEYITRHRKKNGRQDVEKALHFLRKLQELISEKGIKLENTGILPMFRALPAYVRANELPKTDADIIELVCNGQLHFAESYILTLLQEYDEDSGQPRGQGYVNQDR